MIIKAIKNDIDQIMNILSTTITEMKSYNNTQWDKNYPQIKDFLEDIEKENLYVLKDEKNIKGFICIDHVKPTEYKELNWSSDKKCMVIHRMAVNLNYRRQGIGSELMKFAEDLAIEKGVNYLKTDTYSINKNMNSLFLKFGFIFIGKINFFGKEKPFYCYDKVLAK